MAGPGRGIYRIKLLRYREAIEYYVLTEMEYVCNYIYMLNKRQKLKASGTFNLRAKQVKDPLFERDAFFDPEDLVQVKYEMLRRVSHHDSSISEAARSFGFSRPSFYKAQDAVESQGLSGLIPQKPGPRAGHKLTEEVLEFVSTKLEHNKSLGAAELSELIREHFGVGVHPRSIERALKRKKKRQGVNSE